MSEKKLIIKGSTLSAIVLITRVGVSFFLMPFVIKMLGLHYYGIWILIGAFVGYYGMLDFGISGAVLRFASREIGAGRRDNIKYYVNSAFFVLCVAGMVIILISVGAAWLSQFFIADKNNLHLFRFAVVILGLSIGISFPLRVFDGLLSAHLRFDLKRYVEFGEIIVRTGLVVLFLEMGYGVLGLAVVSASVMLGELIIKAFVAHKIDSSLRMGLSFFSRKHLKEMLDYALFSFLNSISNILTNRLDPYVVTIVSSVTAVAQYGVALTLANYFGEFFRTTLGVLFPVFSKRDGSADNEGIQRWVSFCTRLSTIVATVFGTMLILYGRPFLLRWVGPSFNATYLYMCILIFPMIFSCSIFPALFVFGATGKHRQYTLLDTLRGIMNLILSLILGYQIGAAGVAAGTAIPCIIFDVILKPYYAFKSIKANPFKLWGDMISACCRTGILILPVWFFFGKSVENTYSALVFIVGIHFFVIMIFGYFILFRKEDQKQVGEFLKQYARAGRFLCRKSA